MAKPLTLQHYVPRFYLKHFSSIQGKKNIICCYDKVKNSIFLQDTYNIACENDFHDLKPGDKSTEKGFQELEGKWSALLKEIIKRQDIDWLTTEQKETMTEFIVAQYLRPIGAREEIEDIRNQFYEKMVKYKMTPALREELEKVKTKESIREHHIDMLNDFRELAKYAFHFKWCLIINNTKTNFWTSDNPTVKWNNVDHGSYGNLGFTCRGFELHFPLSPNLLLILCDPVAFSHLPSKVHTEDINHVIYENNLQIFNSTRFLFSKDGNFYFARKYLQEHPKYRDPKRKKVTVS